MPKSLELLGGDAPESATEKQEETENRHSVQEAREAVESALVRALAAWRTGDFRTALRAMDGARRLAKRRA